MSLSMLGVILDLETFWSEEGLSGLPKGVIESLRKVTPSNGLLSFERFCAGLKICLLRYQVFTKIIQEKRFHSNLFSKLKFSVSSRNLKSSCLKDLRRHLFSMWNGVLHQIFLRPYILAVRQLPSDPIMQCFTAEQSVCLS